MSAETKFSDETTEQAYLGCLFRDTARAYSMTVNAGMNVDWFTNPFCRDIFKAAVDMIHRGQKLDSILIRNELTSATGAYPFSVSTEIDRWQDMAIVPHTLFYITILKQKWEARVFTQKIVKASESLDGSRPIQEVISALRHDLTLIPGAIAEPMNKEEIITAEEAGFELARTRGYSGVQSRWLKFQERFGGWPKGKLTLVGGRPKQGKSTLCNNESAWASMHGTAVFVASMEMTSGEWLTNAICAEAGLDASKFRNGRFTDEELATYRKFKGIFSKVPLFVDDRTHSIGTLCTAIRDMVTDHGCELAIIDYLQMIKSEGKHKTRNEEVGNWSNQLSNLAKELPDTALVAISQLSRGIKVDYAAKRGETAKPAKPELHHLRDSGSLEQDAYMVVFVYQDPDCGMEIMEDNAPTLVEVAARRGGKTGAIELNFEKSKQRFV